MDIRAIFTGKTGLFEIDEGHLANAFITPSLLSGAVGL